MSRQYLSHANNNFTRSILFAFSFLLFRFLLGGLSALLGFFGNGVDDVDVVFLLLVQVNRAGVVVFDDPEDDIQRQHGDDGPRERVQQLDIRFFLHRIKGVKWMNLSYLFINKENTIYAHKR